MAKKALPLPGDELKKLLEEYNISIAQVSKEVGLSVSAIRQILSGKAKVSLHIAKRLSKYFPQTTVKYWIDLQTAYDLAELDKDTELNDELKKIPKAKKNAQVSAPVKSGKGGKGGKAVAEKAQAKGGKGSKGGKKAGTGKDASDKSPRKPRAKKEKQEEIVTNSESEETGM